MRRAAVTALFLLAAITHPATARADTFRCGVNLVNVGDSEESVRDKCGPPTLTQRRITRGRRAASTYDEWTFNLGSTQFVRILIFDAKADRLLEIVLGDYGT